jgi:hypothetical protein
MKNKNNINNTIKKESMTEPIEKHETASWANMEDLKPVSRVNIPSETEVMNAKEYVDSNEK